MSTGLLTQLQSYYSQIDELQDPIRPDEVAQLLDKVRELPLPPVRVPVRVPRRGLRVAAVTAAIVLLLVGGVAWLSRQGEGEVVDQSTTIDPSTTATTVAEIPEFDIEGFAPSMSGVGFVNEEWVSFGLGSQEFTVRDTTFAVWDGTVGIDWRDVIRSVVDESTRLSIENQRGGAGGQYREVFREWIPELGFIDFHWGHPRPLANLPSEGDSFAQLRLDFKGSSDDWVIDVSDVATGNPVGSIAGSLPGLEEDQILAEVAGGFGRIGWFFVSDGEDQVVVTPPWTSYFAPGGSRFIVAGETIFAFMVTGEDGPGQMTIWSSTDGQTWEDLGWTPWLGHIYAIDTLVERNGEILALVVNSGERPSNEKEGTIHYWSSSDGVNWVELTEDEWDEKSSGIDPTRDPEPDSSVVAYFDAVASNGTVIPDEAVVIQPAQGPEPQFDTSTLGRQIPLEPAAPGVTVARRLRNFSDDHDEEPTVFGLILYIGRIAEPFEAEFLVWTDDQKSGWCEAFLEPGRGGIGGCIERPLNTDDPLMFRTSEHFVLFVPLDAAAVVLTLADGEPMWQRPIGGWALFPRNLNPNAPWTLEIYDATGSIIATDSWLTR